MRFDCWDLSKSLMLQTELGDEASSNYFLKENEVKGKKTTIQEKKPSGFLSVLKLSLYLSPLTLDPWPWFVLWPWWFTCCPPQREPLQWARSPGGGRQRGRDRDTHQRGWWVTIQTCTVCMHVVLNYTNTSMCTFATFCTLVSSWLNSVIHWTSH